MKALFYFFGMAVIHVAIVWCPIHMPTQVHIAGTYHLVLSPVFPCVHVPFLE